MRSPICKRLVRPGCRDAAIITGGILSGFVYLLVVQVAAAAQQTYPVFTEANLEKAMKTAATSIVSGRMSLATNDIAGAKSQFIHAREELAVTISFWRDRKKDDAIGMLRETLTKLDELDTALSGQTVGRVIADGLARRVDEACEACHTAYREQDPRTKAYRLKPGSI